MILIEAVTYRSLTSRPWVGIHRIWCRLKYLVINIILTSKLHVILFFVLFLNKLFLEPDKIIHLNATLSEGGVLL